MLPEALNLHVVPPNIAENYDMLYFSDCKSSWTDETLQIYQIGTVFFLFIIPFILMSVAYYQIAKVLWIKHIPGSAERSSPTANSGSRRSSAQINRSFRSSNSNRNLFYLCLCYLCGCRCAASRCCRKKRGRQTNLIIRKMHLNEPNSQQQSPNSLHQNNKISKELNGCLRDGGGGGGYQTANPVDVDGSLQCTPLDTPPGGQPPIQQQQQQCNVSQSTVNADGASERSAVNEPNTPPNTGEHIIEASYPSTLSAKHFERQETSIVNLQEQPLNPTQTDAATQSDANSSSPPNNLRTNHPNNLSNNTSNSSTATDSTSRPSLMRTAIGKLSRCKTLLLRLLRLEPSAKNKHQANGGSLVERQDTNKTELTTLSNGQIEFGNSFQTTSFIRSRSTRVRTAEEKNSRSSTPIQTLSHQSSFKRLRRMTLPGNRLSKYISGEYSRFSFKSNYDRCSTTFHLNL